MPERFGPSTLASALALLACVSCSPAPATAPAYAANDCRRVAIIDQGEGAPIAGIEDLALDLSNERIFLSAYDRRKVEKAARRKAVSVPEGGVYSLKLPSLKSGESIQASSLVQSVDIAGGLRPHGIAYDAQTEDILFINRGYQRRNGDWLRTEAIERVGADGEIFKGARQPPPCAANDLVDDGGDVIVSFDHEACNWRGGVEDALNLKRSGLADAGDGAVLFAKAGFANGVALSYDGALILAATRENALLVMAKSDGGLREARRIDLPGGPDNLTIAEDGGVIAAVHPSLWRIGLNRRFGLGKAPSRIVKVDLESGGVTLLFDDPAGDLFSAATVAVEAGGMLVAGSVTDSGLLVCEARA